MCAMFPQPPPARVLDGSGASRRDIMAEVDALRNVLLELERLHVRPAARVLRVAMDRVNERDLSERSSGRPTSPPSPPPQVP